METPESPQVYNDTDEDEVFVGKNITDKEQRKAMKYSKRKTAIFRPGMLNKDRKSLRCTLESSLLPLEECENIDDGYSGGSNGSSNGDLQNICESNNGTSDDGVTYESNNGSGNGKMQQSNELNMEIDCNGTSNESVQNISEPRCSALTNEGREKDSPSPDAMSVDSGHCSVGSVTSSTATPEAGQFTSESDLFMGAETNGSIEDIIADDKSDTDSLKEFELFEAAALKNTSMTEILDLNQSNNESNHEIDSKVESNEPKSENTQPKNDVILQEKNSGNLDINGDCTNDNHVNNGINNCVTALDSHVVKESGDSSANNSISHCNDDSVDYGEQIVPDIASDDETEVLPNTAISLTHNEIESRNDGHSTFNSTANNHIAEDTNISINVMDRSVFDVSILTVPACEQSGLHQNGASPVPNRLFGVRNGIDSPSTPHTVPQVNMAQSLDSSFDLFSDSPVRCENNQTNVAQITGNPNWANNVYDMSQMGGALTDIASPCRTNQSKLVFTEDKFSPLPSKVDSSPPLMKSHETSPSVVFQEHQFSPQTNLQPPPSKQNMKTPPRLCSSSSKMHSKPHSPCASKNLHGSPKLSRSVTPSRNNKKLIQPVLNKACKLRAGIKTPNKTPSSTPARTPTPSHHSRTTHKANSSSKPIDVRPKVNSAAKLQTISRTPQSQNKTQTHSSFKKPPPTPSSDSKLKSRPKPLYIPPHSVSQSASKLYNNRNVSDKGHLKKTHPAVAPSPTRRYAPSIGSLEPPPSPSRTTAFKRNVTRNLESQLAAAQSEGFEYPAVGHGSLDDSLMEKKELLEKLRAEKKRLQMKIQSKQKEAQSPQQRMPLMPTSADNLPRVRYKDTEALTWTEPQTDAMTQLNTMLNGQPVAKIIRKPTTTTIYRHNTVPKPASKLHWDEALEHKLNESYIPNPDSPSKPILNLKEPNELYPYCNELPSPVVVRKTTKQKSPKTIASAKIEKQ